MRIHRTQNSLGGWQQLPAFLLRQPRFPYGSHLLLLLLLLLLFLLLRRETASALLLSATTSV